MAALSVLDLSYVAEGLKPSAALAQTVELAQACDRLGYTRYWVAEHHNIPSVASSAPEVIIARIGAATRRIRVGAGGVMLPNHAPLMVAERFKTLEAFFPGRVDLGLGRAPGTDPVTSYALRRHQAQSEQDVFLDRLQELILWETGGFAPQHPMSKVRPEPSDAPLPPLFLLGSSDFSAQLAGEIGVAFAFAHHFATHDAVDAMQTYRARFKPSRWRDRPLAILATSVVAADDAAQAERLAASADLSALRRAQGSYQPLPSPQTAAAYSYTDEERAIVRANRRRLFVGTGEAVRARLEQLAQATGADEIMIASPLYALAARRRCYEILAESFGLEKSACDRNDAQVL